MKISADLSLIPIGVGVSLSEHVALAIRILRDRGLTPTIHAHGTTVEGDYDLVFAALKEAIESVHAAGAPRISTSIKISSRVDREQSDAEKVASAQRHLHP